MVSHNIFLTVTKTELKAKLKEKGIKCKYHDKICADFKQTIMNIKDEILNNSIKNNVLISNVIVDTAKPVKFITLDKFTKKKGKKNG